MVREYRVVQLSGLECLRWGDEYIRCFVSPLFRKSISVLLLQKQSHRGLIAPLSLSLSAFFMNSFELITFLLLIAIIKRTESADAKSPAEAAVVQFHLKYLN